VTLPSRSLIGTNQTTNQHSTQQTDSNQFRNKLGNQLGHHLTRSKFSNTDSSAAARRDDRWVKEVEKSEGVGVIVFSRCRRRLSLRIRRSAPTVIDYLAAHRAEIWTASYSEAMDYVVKHAR